MTTAFWQAGDYSAAARAVRDWIRVEPERPAPHRTAARIYEDMGALWQAIDAAERETAVAPRDATAWERLGRLRMRRFDRDGARDALERARAHRARPRRGCSTSPLIAHLTGDLGAEVSACEQATRGRAGVRRAPGRATPTRSRAPTAPRTASPRATARSSCAEDPEVRALAAARPRAPAARARRLTPALVAKRSRYRAFRDERRVCGRGG